MKEFCVNLEIAKELKANGFPQETLLYHTPGSHIYGWDGEHILTDDGSWSIVDYNASEYPEWHLSEENETDDECFVSEEREKELAEQVCSAPISDEIGQFLPQTILNSNGEISLLVCGKYRGEWYCDYHIYRPKPLMQYEFVIGFSDKKESNARAKMWLYLKRKGYIK